MAAASVSIGAGTSTKSYYVLDTTAEALSLSVSATSFVPGSGALTVLPNVLTKLSVSGTAAINASTCSSALTVTAQDAQNNSVNVASNTAVNLSGAGAGGAFYSDNGCTAAVTSVTVGTGTSSQLFYYKTTSAGSPVLTAASAALTSGTLTMTVTGLPATKLVITGPSPITVNACSSAYTVTARDASNNITNVSSSTSVALSGGQGVFYSDSSCTLPVSGLTIGAGTSTLTVYFKDLSGEALTLAASASGLTAGTLAVTQTAPSLSNVQLLAGSYDVGGGNDSATAVLQRFNSANSVTSDGTNLYVSDHFGIHKTPLAGGAWTTLAGSIGNAGSTDGTGTAANFNTPAQMTILAGNLYVTDNGNSTIRKIVLATGVVTTLAGAAGGVGTTDGTGGGARFSYPNGITNDGTNLYVSDQGNHCIRKITTAAVVTTLAGLCGNGGSSDSAMASSVRFNNPQEIVALGSYLYVADFNNYAIRQVTIATGATTTFAGQMGNGGSTDAAGTSARFNQPYGISTDGSNLYVGDYSNHVIRQIVISSAIVTTIAGNYQRGYSDGTAGLGKFNYPVGSVAVAGILYIVDRNNGMVRTLSLGSGNLSTLAGPSASLMAKFGGAGGQDGVGIAAQFNNAQLAVEVNGYLYVTEQANQKIRRVAVGTGATVSFVGSGASGYQDGAYSATKFSNPAGITSDGVNLFVADQSNHCIRKVVIATGVVSAFGGSCGNGGYTDSATPSAVRFNNPIGITIDSSKTNLYIADFSNQAIRKVVIASGATTTFAGGGGGSNDGTGIAAQFNGPAGITTDGTNLYIADYYNHLVRQITIAGAVVTTLAGSPGAKGLVNGPGLASKFNYPNTITCDGANLYVSDTQNQAYRKIVINTGVTSTYLGIGPSAFGDDDSATPTLIQNPNGVYYSNSGLFLISRQRVDLMH